METAKLINITMVAGVEKMRCECVNCKERWNRSLQHVGVPTTCRFCKTDQFNPTPVYRYVCAICNYDFPKKEEVNEALVGIRHYEKTRDALTTR